MARGRPADPLEVREAKGNPQKRPLPHQAPRRIEGSPTPPPWLMDDPEAVEYWAYFSDVLFARGQLSMESSPSMAALVLCCAEWARLARDLREHGYSNTRYGENGAFDVTRPEVAAFADADRRLKGWLNEFGLTDATRGKVVAAGKAKPGDDNDPLSRYGLN